MTCVGPLHTGQPNPSVMLSGTKDGTITVWDIRQQKAAIHMHVEEAGAEGEPMVCRPLLERCCHAHALQWLAHHACVAEQPGALLLRHCLRKS